MAQPTQPALPRVKTWAATQRWTLLIAVLLIANFLLFNPLYLRFFLHVGKPESVGAVRGNEGTASYYIDKFEQTHFAGQETYQLIGWAFPQEMPRPLLAYRRQLVLIDAHNRAYYFAAITMDRPDVTQYFKALGLDLNASGFLVNISKYGLPRGEYSLAFLFSSADGSAPILARTNLSILRTANNLELIK